MHADAAFEVGRQCRPSGLLNTENGRKPEFEDAGMRARSTIIIPVAGSRLPVASQVPIAELKEFLAPVPLRSESVKIDVCVRRIGMSVFKGHAVNGIRHRTYGHQNGKD